jgi:hypothetical protein
MRARAAFRPPRAATRFLCWLFIVAASAFDCYATLALISTGLYHEWNPIARFFLNDGAGVFIAWRMTSLGLAFGGVAFFAKKYRLAWLLLVAGAILYAGVCAYYLYHLWLIRAP